MVLPLAARMPGFSGDPLLLAFLETVLDAFDAAAGLPRKSRLDVARLGAAGTLPYIWITERGDDGRFRYRLAGEQVRDNFGRPIKNAPLDDVLEAGNAREIAQMYQTMLADRAVGYSVGPTIGQRYSYLSQRIMVPACDDEGRGRFIVACFQRSDVDQLAPDHRTVTFTIHSIRYYPLADLVA